MVYSSKSYSKAFGASQCCWFSYWSISGVLFILQALTPSRETILHGSRTERLYSVSRLYALNALGYYYDTKWWLIISYIHYLIEWLVMHKYKYLFLYKQVIISCGFCQHLKCLKILLSSWINLWYLNILVQGLRF